MAFFVPQRSADFAFCVFGGITSRVIRDAFDRDPRRVGGSAEHERKSGYCVCGGSDCCRFGIGIDSTVDTSKRVWKHHLYDTGNGDLFSCDPVFNRTRDGTEYLVVRFRARVGCIVARRMRSFGCNACVYCDRLTASDGSNLPPMEAVFDLAARNLCVSACEFFSASPSWW